MKVIKANETSLIMNASKAVVDFYATWCGPCMYMKPYFEAAEKSINDLGAECFEVNVDECENFANINKIQFVPCVIYFENGKEKDRFTGGRDTAGIVEFVTKNINK